MDFLFLLLVRQLDATDFVGPTLPPTTTVTTQTTQFTGYTGETISGTYSGIGLDGIATDIQEIINNQRWQIMQNDVMIQNSRRTNDNLSIIIEQLNRIYANMLANGEISPELVQAHPLDTIPPDIANHIQTALRHLAQCQRFWMLRLVGEFWVTDGKYFFPRCFSCLFGAAWV